MKQRTTAEKLTNYLSYYDYLNWLKQLQLNVFEWVGLPESINVRYLETTLMSHGFALFFHDEKLGYLALQGAAAGELNVYGEPVAYQIVSHAYSREISAMDCVIVKNNIEWQPSWRILSAFAARLSHIERITDINLNAQKTPILILTDDKQKLTMQNMYAQYEGNTPVVFADKNIVQPDSVKVLSTAAPYLVDKLDEHKKNLWDEALTLMGINNANTNKKERLIVDEVNANDSNVHRNLLVLLAARQKSAEEINKKFGLNVSVKVRDEITGDDKHGEVHGGTRTDDSKRSDPKTK